MKIILLILIIAFSAFAQTEAEYSFWNYGVPDVGVRDAIIIQHYVDFFDGLSLIDSVRFPYHYKYTGITDSSFAYESLDRRPKVRVLYFNPTHPLPTLLNVTIDWVTIKRQSPATSSHTFFSGWQGGPDKKLVEKYIVTKPVDMDMIKRKADDYRKNFNIIYGEKAKAWKDKAGKTIQAKDKEGYAWRLATKKEEYLVIGGEKIGHDGQKVK